MTDSGPPAPRSEFLLYNSEDGRTRLSVRFEGETVWLTQAQLADLFQTTSQNITIHIGEIYADGEQDEAATCKYYLQVRQEGARSVQRRHRLHAARVGARSDAIQGKAAAAKARVSAGHERSGRDHGDRTSRDRVQGLDCGMRPGSEP